MIKKANLFLILVLVISFNFNAISQNKIKPNGYNKFYYPGGIISSEGNMKNGKPIGFWKSYYPNGTKKTEGYRKSDKLDSLWKFFDQKGFIKKSINYRNSKKNGYYFTYKLIDDSLGIRNTLISKELYLEDKKSGESFYYDEHSRLKTNITYEDGYKHGLEKHYNEKGEVIAILKYFHDNLAESERINRRDREGRKQGNWKTFFPNGNVYISSNFRNDLLHGFYREYNVHGRVIKTDYYSEGKIVNVNEISKDDKESQAELKKEYFQSGQLKAAGNYVKDIPVGVHKEFDKNGNVTRTETFDEEGIKKSIGLVDKKGKKQGKWKYIYTTGEKKAVGVYKNSRRIGEWKFYFKNGTTEQYGKYKNGRTSGIWTWYYNNKNIRRTGNFVKGKETGFFYELTIIGDTLSKGLYVKGEKEGVWFRRVNDHKETGEYKQNLRSGIWKHYYPDEILEFEGNFVNGKADGEQKYYYPNGKIKLVSNYELDIKAERWKKYDFYGNLETTILYRSGRVYKIDGKKVKDYE